LEITARDLKCSDVMSAKCLVCEIGKDEENDEVNGKERK
jgi:hypothetical protein